NTVYELATIFNVSKSMLNFSIFVLLIILVFFIFMLPLHNSPEQSYIKSSRINVKMLFVFFSFFFILVISSVINNYSSSGLTQFVALFRKYVLLLTSFLVLSFKGNAVWFDDKISKKVFLYYSIINSILGIFQYLTKQTIIPSVDLSNHPIVFSVYYLNGESSRYPFIGQDYQLRAFGMAMSGGSLGLFCLLALAIVYFGNLNFSKTKKILLSSILLTSIYMTLTRGIWLIT
ncbi:hypothetical protein, partial [Oenococcus oeni]|uniref:hypothetical protein n=1 Tax=Oenococcus oeni TaxID=1247 RepID=UPI0015D674D3